MGVAPSGTPSKLWSMAVLIAAANAGIARQAKSKGVTYFMFPPRALRLGFRHSLLLGSLNVRAGSPKPGYEPQGGKKRHNPSATIVPPAGRAVKGRICALR